MYISGMLFNVLSPVHTSDNVAKNCDIVAKRNRQHCVFGNNVAGLLPVSATMSLVWTGLRRQCRMCGRDYVLRGGSAVGRWTCDLQVAGSIPGRWLSRNIGQLSLASLRGR